MLSSKRSFFVLRYLGFLVLTWFCLGSFLSPTPKRKIKSARSRPPIELVDDDTFKQALLGDLNAQKSCLQFWKQRAKKLKVPPPQSMGPLKNNSAPRFIIAQTAQAATLCLFLFPEQVLAVPQSCREQSSFSFCDPQRLKAVPYHASLKDGATMRRHHPHTLVIGASFSNPYTLAGFERQGFPLYFFSYPRTMEAFFSQIEKLGSDLKLNSSSPLFLKNALAALDHEAKLISHEEKLLVLFSYDKLSAPEKNQLLYDLLLRIPSFHLPDPKQLKSPQEIAKLNPDYLLLITPYPEIARARNDCLGPHTELRAITDSAAHSPTQFILYAYQQILKELSSP